VILRARAEEMLRVQSARSFPAGAEQTVRVMYAKTVVGVTNALLVVDRTLPRDLAVAHFRPGAQLRAVMRFSNAGTTAQSDRVPDMRGVSLRIAASGREPHDLILANFPTAIARNAQQFFEMTIASAGDREALLARLAERIGIAESRRVAVNLRSSLKLCSSLATQRFWSGCAFLWGARPVHFQLRPTVPTQPLATGSAARSGDALRLELAERLATRDVTFRFAIQRYVDEARTPIEDAATRWKESVSRPIEMATLIIPRQELASSESQAVRLQVDRTRFDPWNAPPQFRPLGSLNRLRRLVYKPRAIADYEPQHRARTRDRGE
jgi:hypothetical protein